jgi:hypothetical protein
MVHDVTDHSSSSSDRGYVIPTDVVARKVGDSAVLVRLETNRIYELNATGARIWELLTQRQSRDEIIDALEREFAADRRELTAAFDELIASLRAEGLI